MKTINVNGREFQYDVVYDEAPFGDIVITEFYDGTKYVSHKKYYFFGEKIIKEIPNPVFYLNINIEDERYSKDEVRKQIEGAVERLIRKEEIKRGDII